MGMNKIWTRRDNLKKRRLKAEKLLTKGQISETEYKHICELEEQTLNHIVLRETKVLHR